MFGKNVWYNTFGTPCFVKMFGCMITSTCTFLVRFKAMHQRPARVQKSVFGHNRRAPLFWLQNVFKISPKSFFGLTMCPDGRSRCFKSNYRGLPTDTFTDFIEKNYVIRQLKKNGKQDKAQMRPAAVYKDRKKRTLSFNFKDGVNKSVFDKDFLSAIF
jgi:hypothetical protein